MSSQHSRTSFESLSCTSSFVDWGAEEIAAAEAEEAARGLQQWQQQRQDADGEKARQCVSPNKAGGGRCTFRRSSSGNGEEDYGDSGEDSFFALSAQQQSMGNWQAQATTPNSHSLPHQHLQRDEHSGERQRGGRAGATAELNSSHGTLRRQRQPAPQLARLAVVNAPTPESSGASFAQAERHANPRSTLSKNGSLSSSTATTTDLEAQLFFDASLPATARTARRFGHNDRQFLHGESKVEVVPPPRSASTHAEQEYTEQEEYVTRTADLAHLLRLPPVEVIANTNSSAPALARYPPLSASLAENHTANSRHGENSVNGKGENKSGDDVASLHPLPASSHPPCSSTAFTWGSFTQRWAELPQLSTTNTISLVVLLIMFPGALVAADVVFYKYIVAAFVAPDAQERLAQFVRVAGLNHPSSSSVSASTASAAARGRSISLLAVRLIWLMFPHGALFRLCKSKGWAAIMAKRKGKEIYPTGECEHSNDRKGPTTSHLSASNHGCASADVKVSSFVTDSYRLATMRDQSAQQVEAQKRQGHDESDSRTLDTTFAAVLAELSIIWFGACEALVLFFQWAWVKSLDHVSVDPYLRFVSWSVKEGVIAPARSLMSALLGDHQETLAAGAALSANLCKS